jgi:predicted PurR-regulated permease PerM
VALIGSLAIMLATIFLAHGIGPIGLIAGVPLTTALAALAAPRLSVNELDAEQAHAGHAH